MKVSSKLYIWKAGLIFSARLRCLNCARKSMTNSASLGEMHRTRASFVRRGLSTQNLVLKIENIGDIKLTNNNLLTVRPCFMFTVLLSTEDSSEVKNGGKSQNYAKLAFRSENKIE